MLRDLELSDIPKLAGFAPQEWNMALDAVLLEHFGRGYFQARVSAESDRILAIGQGIATGHAGWIGNIIVRPEARRRGLGTHVTLDIVNLLRARGCSTLLLASTKLGEPVYKKLGFRKTAEYVFLRVPRLPAAPAPNVRRIQPSEAEAVFRQDAFATGETRGDLLAPHLGAGWAHIDSGGALDGFFLPSLGAGLVVASRPPAGLALLGFKHAFYPGNAAVPAGNGPALRFLIEHGAAETAWAPRMALGDEVSWRPECIFARGAGYCG
jgi:GNAT superfamily N-acetyltransferase